MIDLSPVVHECSVHHINLIFLSTFDLQVALLDPDVFHASPLGLGTEASHVHGFKHFLPPFDEADLAADILLFSGAFKHFGPVVLQVMVESEHRLFRDDIADRAGEIIGMRLRSRLLPEWTDRTALPQGFRLHGLGGIGARPHYRLHLEKQLVDPWIFGFLLDVRWFLLRSLSHEEWKIISKYNQ